jgi:hypothetical protein
MNRCLFQSAIGAILLIAGFFAGRLFQHTKNGYHFEIRQKKDFQSPMGLVEWSYVTESVGLPFLDPGKTIIEFKGRTLYKAGRTFQEKYPFARNIQTSDKSIDWDDGEIKYHRTIDEIKPQNSPKTNAGTSTN